MLPGQRPYIHWRELGAHQHRAHGPREARPSRNSLAAAKDAELVMLYMGGASMREIGRAVGLSGERVRQRLNRVGFSGADRQGWVSTDAWITRNQKRDAKATAKQERFDQDTARLKALAERLGRTPTQPEAAKELGAPEGVWQTTGSGGWLAHRGGRRGRGPYQSFVAALYAAAGLTVRGRGWFGHLNHGPRARKTHCIRGHDLTDPANLYVSGTQRQCRPCALIWKAAAYQRKKAARA